LQLEPVKIDLQENNPMQKNFPFLLILIIVAASCKNHQKFIVEGRVPNAVSEGSKVYLVALDAPVTRNVDSTNVAKGRFRFEVDADSLSVKILRIPVRFPDIIEDLVVIPETGKIRVVLDSVSYGEGTRLNNILQRWKERKHFHDSIQWSLFTQQNVNGSDQLKSDSLLKVSEELNTIFLLEIISLLNENLNNGIGLLLFKIYYDKLPASEKNYVMEQTGKEYFERDAELMKRIR